MLLLGACTTAPIVWDGTVNEQIDKWNQEEAFGKSLDAISNITIKHKEFDVVTARKDEVEKLASAYEEKTIKAISKSREKGDWKNVFKSLKEVEWKYPRSIALIDERTKTLEIHQTVRDTIELQRHYARAEWLEQELKLQKELINTAPDETIEQWNLENLEGESVSLAATLAKDGDREFSHKKYAEAEKAYEYSLMLNPTPGVRKSLEHIETLKKEKINAKIKKEQARKKALLTKKNRALKVQQQKEQSLVQAYHNSIKNNALSKARKAALALRKMKPDDKTYKANVQHIEKLIKSHVDSRYSNGANLYSRGDHNGAIKEWENVLKLDPNHEASKISLDRAKRVIEMLEKIKKQQQQ
jgi:tetratricopeptide (TPR) repeat protein